MLTPHLRRHFTTSVAARGTQLVTLHYNDLLAGVDLSKDIQRAYGPSGLGALTIAGIPGYMEARYALLPLSHKIAHLPESEKVKLEHPESMYNVGWSHGKEKMGDKPDTSKGSYYGNPLYDEAGSPEMRAKYPFFYPKNIWPTAALPELEPAFKRLGTLMFKATVLLTQQIDALVAAKVSTYPKTFLFDNIVDTQKVKGRVLYYYPQADTTVDDGWIAWHNDSGFLTALAGDVFFNDDTGEIIPNPDRNGGLWIVDRNGGPLKVDIPPDHMAVQCGECLQIITGGLLVATPHSVRASQAPTGIRVGRGSFPVFIDTQIDFKLSPPPGVSREQVFDRTIQSRVPPLEQRWERDGVPFVEFLGTTFQRYYEWSTKEKKR